MTCTLEDSTDNENVVQMESAISFLVCVCVGGGGGCGKGGQDCLSGSAKHIVHWLIL